MPYKFTKRELNRSVFTNLAKKSHATADQKLLVLMISVIGLIIMLDHILLALGSVIRIMSCLTSS